MIGWIVAAFAGPADAEAERLREELVRMAERNTWAAVDRAYRGLLDLGAALRASEHLLGGQAALAAGDPLLAWHRFRRAEAPPPNTAPADAEAWESATGEAAHLERRYGKVALCVGPARLPVLVRPEAPFAQQERDAVARVAEALRAGRCHRGLLPVGAYSLDGEPFEVSAGEGWVVVNLGWN